MAPPGVVAFPRLSADPAVLEPCVLESFDEGIVLSAAGPVVPFFIGMPPPEVVPPFIESPVVVLLAADPPACEPPPAVLPAPCARAAELAAASAVAKTIVAIFMGSFPLF